MIKDIVFLEPKNENLHIYSKYDLPRLGNVLLATIMKNIGYKTSAYFMKRKEIIALNLKPDLVAISTITPTAFQAYKLADHYRAAGISVVMGGPHVTFMPEEALDHADYVIMGEGESALPKLVNVLNTKGDYRTVPGLAWKEGKKIKKNALANMITDLDSLPHPDFSLLRYGQHNFRNLFVRKKIPIQTSRGCPFDCNFCSVTGMFGKGYRFRSTDNIIEEIRQYDPRKHYLFFYDDNFTANRRRAKEVLQKMIDLKLGFNWSTQVRCDVAKDKELLDLMKKAGCSALYIGFESIDPDSLKEMKKRQTVDDIKFAIKEIRKRNIHIHGMFVLGFDSDTPKNAKTTVEFAIKQKIDSVQFMILTPLPGTEFYHSMLNQNRIIDMDWDKYDAHHVKFKPRNFTPWELQKAQIYAHTRFYAPHHVFMRLLRGRLTAFIIGIYANAINKQWQKIEKEYLTLLKSMFSTKKHLPAMS
ncbi:MAG: B12-binding domain-containing radical SAM protein [Spirochaetales bacterium]|nr:B12-binding domain-containing radical SAM protein [Spirochaetales bacterium]